VQRDTVVGSVDGADVAVRLRDDGQGMEEMGAVHIEHSSGSGGQCGAHYDGGVGGAGIRLGLGNEDLSRLFGIYRVQLGDSEHGGVGRDVEPTVSGDRASLGA